MRYFIDAEFNGFGGDLISFAAVPEFDDVPPFYEAVYCTVPTPWATDHVIPILRTIPRALQDVSTLLSQYLGDDQDITIIADWPEDIAHAARLFTDNRGKRLLTSSVRFELMNIDFSTEKYSKLAHNAYYDAVALRDFVLEMEKDG